MSKMKFQAHFDAQVVVEFDTDDYPHYADGKRGGWEELARDMVYDNAELDHPCFEDGSFQAQRVGVAEVVSGE